MRRSLPGPDPADFIWAGGIEDTFIPQTRPGHRPLDEYDLIGHYDHWREDLALARDVCMQALRWGVPWYRVEPRRGQFDWTWTDQVVPYIVEELGITPIVDLMHYGCPLWLEREFDNREYSRAVADYAAEFARRYSSLVRWYTPLNEPLINSLLCGKHGVWPPYLRGDAGYIRVMMQLVKGMLATVEAIKAVDASAIMVHVEAAGLSRTTRPDLEPLAVEDQYRRMLSWDLLTGMVMPDHPLFPWLLRNGASPDDLVSIANNHITLDVLGLNFYPQWSTHQLYVSKEGRVVSRTTEREGVGFGEMIETYYRRYRAPVIVTETSAFGSQGTRSRWLAAGVAAIKSLRERGIPVLGFTWFPMLTMVRWSYRKGRGPMERYKIELGLYKLRDGDGPRWAATPLVSQLRSYINDPERAIGYLGSN